MKAIIRSCSSGVVTTHRPKPSACAVRCSRATSSSDAPHGGDKIAGPTEQGGFAGGKAHLFTACHRVAPGEAEAVFPREGGEIGTDFCLDAAGIGDQARAGKLRAVLPHESNGGLRIEGKDQQIQPPQIVPGSREIDRSAGQRTVKDSGIAVEAPDGAVRVFPERLCEGSHRSVPAPRSRRAGTTPPPWLSPPSAAASPR